MATFLLWLILRVFCWPLAILVAVLYPLICARLCVSVTNSAYQQSVEPDNDYLTISERPAWALLDKLEKIKASIRAKVEHPFHVVKNLFKHRKTRYKGLAKNAAQLMTLFGLANLVLARRWLLAADSQVAS